MNHLFDVSHKTALITGSSEGLGFAFARAGAQVIINGRNSEKLEKAADAFGVGKTYTDYAEMLESEDLDGVVVATSHASHYDAGKAALQHGCHVLIEKPMALCSAHAHELLGIARDNDLHIVMSCPWQFTGHAIKAAEILQSGELGEIQHVSSMCHRITPPQACSQKCTEQVCETQKAKRR